MPAYECGYILSSVFVLIFFFQFRKNVQCVIIVRSSMCALSVAPYSAQATVCGSDSISVTLSFPCLNCVGWECERVTGYIMGNTLQINHHRLTRCCELLDFSRISSEVIPDLKCFLKYQSLRYSELYEYFSCVENQLPEASLVVHLKAYVCSE